MAPLSIKIAQLNVLLKSQLKPSLMISQIPVQSANTRADKNQIWGAFANPLNPRI